MIYEDCSRDQLIEYCKSMGKTLLQQGNNPSTRPCPFCYGNKLVSSLKCQVKEGLIAEWRRDVTQEEYEAWWKEYQERFAK